MTAPPCLAPARARDPGSTAPARGRRPLRGRDRASAGRRGWGKIGACPDAAGEVARPLIRDPDRDDAVLMARIGRGDANAFEELYRRHGGAVLALCLRILRDRAEAEDVLEEVFWELWQRRDRYDRERAAPFSYLMTLTRSRALDRLRFRRRREGVWQSMGVGEPPAAPEDPTPYDGALVAEQRAAIERALRELPEASRRAVELNFFEGLSHREIADRLGDPLGTVKTRIRQGLLSLRKVLRALREGRLDA